MNLTATIGAAAVLTALAAALRRSGERKYHQRAWVSVTNRVLLTIGRSGHLLG